MTRDRQPGRQRVGVDDRRGDRRASWRVRGLASPGGRGDGRGARLAQAGRVDSAAVECLQPPTLTYLWGFPPIPVTNGQGAPASLADTASNPFSTAPHSRLTSVMAGYSF